MEKESKFQDLQLLQLGGLDQSQDLVSLPADSFSRLEGFYQPEVGSLHRIPGKIVMHQFPHPIMGILVMYSPFGYGSIIFQGPDLRIGGWDVPDPGFDPNIREPIDPFKSPYTLDWNITCEPKWIFLPGEDGVAEYDHLMDLWAAAQQAYFVQGQQDALENFPGGPNWQNDFFGLQSLQCPPTTTTPSLAPTPRTPPYPFPLCSRRREGIEEVISIAPYVRFGPKESYIMASHGVSDYGLVALDQIPTAPSLHAGAWVATTPDEPYIKSTYWNHSQVYWTYNWAGTAHYDAFWDAAGTRNCGKLDFPLLLANYPDLVSVEVGYDTTYYQDGEYDMKPHYTVAPYPHHFPPFITGVPPQIHTQIWQNVSEHITDLVHSAVSITPPSLTVGEVSSLHPPGYANGREQSWTMNGTMLRLRYGGNLCLTRKEWLQRQQQYE